MALRVSVTEATNMKGVHFTYYLTVTLDRYVGEPQERDETWVC